jgi:hypothetical protein
MTGHLLGIAIETYLLCTTPGTEDDNEFCGGKVLTPLEGIPTLT